MGGGYGAKITRSSQTAAACALGAYITGRYSILKINCSFILVFVYRPVRMHMDLETNMSSVGKRFPYVAKYSVSIFDFIAFNKES